MYKSKPKPRPQFDIVDRDRIPFAVILGPDEWKEGRVRIKEQKGKEEAAGAEDSKGTLVERGEMIAWVKTRLEGGR